MEASHEKWLKTFQPVAMSFRLRCSYFSQKDIFQQLSEGWIWGSTIDTICNRVGASQIIYINNDKKIGCTRPRLSVDRIRSRIQLISRLFSEFDQTAWRFMGVVVLSMTELSITKEWILLAFWTYTAIYLQLVKNFSNWHYSTELKKKKVIMPITEVW